MIPLGRPGLVQEGQLKGWWVRVQEQDLPHGFLVTRSRAPEMQDTVVVDGIFPDRATLEGFFAQHAPGVAWAD